MTYENLKKLLNGRKRKKLENNTWGELHDNGIITVTLHKTVVVRAEPDGQFTLNSGGYRTATTKDRISRYSPTLVWQKHGQWFYGNGEEFQDGVIVS